MTTRGRRPRPGRIMFVGSGPGDPALLTTRAATVLANAPLVFIDPDVPEPVLALIGKDLPPVTNGLIWRIFADRPDESGAFKVLREDRTATPNIVLPPGNYVVHVTLGLVSAVRTVTLKAETDREAFLLPAGGLRIEGRVGTSKIPTNQISFAIYKGSQFEGGDRAPLVPSVAPGDVVLMPEAMPARSRGTTPMIAF